MKKLQRSVERFKGNTLGLDLHKRLLQISVLDQAGDETENERLAASAPVLTALIDRLTKDGMAVQVVLEASGCFLWAYDLLAAKLGKERVHVAAPSKVKAIANAGEKTDATDAWWLAYLQYEGRLPHAFAAEGDLRELRIVCREHRRVIDERSDLVRRMRAHLAQLGMSIGTSDFKSALGYQRIAKLVEEVKPAHGQRGSAIARLWDRIQWMDEEVGHWREQIQALAQKSEQVQLLDDELAGVGETLAPIIWSELGDPHRFRSEKAYAKTTGLTPGYRESAGHRSRHKMTREGSSLARWALTQAVMSCLRCRQGDGMWVKRWVQKMRKRKSMKATIVAAARKLAEAVWRLFALGEAFDLARSFGGPPAQALPQPGKPVPG